MAFFGGVKRSYPVEKIYEEIAFISYYNHWPYETLMNMEHRERVRWCKELSKINKNLNGENERKYIFDV